jgi:hypothetical protein
VPSRVASSFALLGFAALLIGCAAPVAVEVDTTATSAADHGAVDGAVEVDEAAEGLTAIDGDGVVRHLDLGSGDVAEIGRIGVPTAVHTDGRYVFADTGDGVEIVDSGVWTWDHTDHFHYYRGPARALGALEGEGEAAVATTLSSTTGSTGVFFTGGEAVLLDTAALAEGEIVERFRIEAPSHAGMVVPIGRHALMTTGADAGAHVVAYDESGSVVDGVSEPCAEPRGTIVTRVGAVIGCADAALIATSISGALSIERVPYPAGTAPRAEQFANRDGRPVVAGLADERGIWLLDTRARSWAFVASSVPLVAVTAVDDEDGRIAAVGVDGRVHVLGESGAVLATSPVMTAHPLTARLSVTASSAYVAADDAPVAEIDLRSGEVRRTFDALDTPAHVALTGQ